MRLVDQALEQVLEEGLDKDFATIPGTPKPTLLQAGAEKLAAIFNLGILLDTKINDLPGGHREVIVTASCVQRSTGKVVGQGVGSCTTMESRYRYRVAPKNLTDRPVPGNIGRCASMIRGQPSELLGGAGFSTKKESGQWYIAEGTDEKVEHDNPSDYHNTVLKIASKRAMVSGDQDDHFDERDDLRSTSKRARPTKPPTHPKRKLRHQNPRKTNGGQHGPPTSQNRPKRASQR